MTYYLRFGRTFFSYPLLIGCVIYLLFGPLRNHHSLLYSDIKAAFILFGIVFSYRFSILLYLGIFQKPVFTANREFMFDHVKNIKYYWDDVKEVEADEYSLIIYLYQPGKYLTKLKNPFYRFVKRVRFHLPGTKHAHTINLKLLNIELGENEQFLEKLNAFSMGEAE